MFCFQQKYFKAHKTSLEEALFLQESGIANPSNWRRVAVWLSRFYAKLLLTNSSGSYSLHGLYVWLIGFGMWLFCDLEWCYVHLTPSSVYVNQGFGFERRWDGGKTHLKITYAEGYLLQEMIDQYRWSIVSSFWSLLRWFRSSLCILQGLQGVELCSVLRMIWPGMRDRKLKPSYLIIMWISFY